MTDPLDSLDDPSDHDLAAIAALVSRADAWVDPARSLEDSVVAAIAAEATAGAGSSETQPAPTQLASRRLPRGGRLLAAAAALAAITLGVVVLGRGPGDDGGVAFALAGTDASPDASAEVVMSATPAGLKIILDADGLPGAPDGYMYEAWVGDGTIDISAGTFHLRGGSGPIELWAGVTDASFDRLWVTLEPIDADTSSSGETRLWGEFLLDDRP